MVAEKRKQEFPEWELLGIEGNDRVSHTCSPASGEVVLVKRFTYLVNLTYDQTLMSLNSDKKSLMTNPKDSVVVIPPDTEIVEYSSLTNAEAMIFQCDSSALSRALGEAPDSTIHDLHYKSDHIS